MADHKKLMIVEDSATQARAIAAYLSKEIDVLIASNGSQALRLVSVQLPDLIILDVNMPKLNGIQVCQRLKRDPDTVHIPIVMISAETSPEQMKEGLSAGADRYIRKTGRITEDLLDVLRFYGLFDKIGTN